MVGLLLIPLRCSPPSLGQWVRPPPHANGRLLQDVPVLCCADPQPCSFHSPLSVLMSLPFLVGVSGLGRSLLLFPQCLQIPLRVWALSAEARETPWSPDLGRGRGST